ncbi:sulfite oxidase-like oxidoreductase [soil metagenome]
MTVDGLVDEVKTWGWRGVRSLPGSTYVGDIHCVTTWTKLDVTFAGVSVDTVLDLAVPRPEAAYVMAHSTTGYTTNLPLADVTGGKAWLVWEFDGRPLTPEHGGPIRLLVPHLYFWKSAKWVNRLELMAENQPGFWESNGYHDRGDPWLEQRYQGDP